MDGKASLEACRDFLENYQNKVERKSNFKKEVARDKNHFLLYEQQFKKENKDLVKDLDKAMRKPETL